MQRGLLCPLFRPRHSPLKYKKTAYTDCPQLLPLIRYSSTPVRRDVVSPIKTECFGVSLVAKKQHCLVLKSRSSLALPFLWSYEYIECVNVTTQPTPKTERAQILMQQTRIVCSFRRDIPCIANDLPVPDQGKPSKFAVKIVPGLQLTASNRKVIGSRGKDLGVNFDHLHVDCL